MPCTHPMNCRSPFAFPDALICLRFGLPNPPQPSTSAFRQTDPHIFNAAEAQRINDQPNRCGRLFLGPDSACTPKHSAACLVYQNSWSWSHPADSCYVVLPTAPHPAEAFFAPKKKCTWLLRQRTTHPYVLRTLHWNVVSFICCLVMVLDRDSKGNHEVIHRTLGSGNPRGVCHIPVGRALLGPGERLGQAIEPTLTFGVQHAAVNIFANMHDVQVTSQPYSLRH